MMREEFEIRTGIHPTAQLYNMIEQHYYKFDGDKDAFCEAYKNDADGLASKIQIEADLAANRREQELKDNIDQKLIQIKRLQEQLEREQEWRPYEDGDNVRQADYDRLRASGREWDEDEAKAWISDDFGFDPERIEILRSVPVYEINRHRQLRRTGEAERLPLYEASDWNYVRFNCGLMSYELSNGQLRLFAH